MLTINELNANITEDSAEEFASLVDDYVHSIMAMPPGGTDNTSLGYTLSEEELDAAVGMRVVNSIPRTRGAGFSW